ncbi:MAG: AmmeMemoRadiSam system protein A [Candidatus Aenigmatarchaeota archaeon]|nr:AmmeMemoRadiSam system protein A [Candidatus Aenigmarchaeota archaeon]
MYKLKKTDGAILLRAARAAIKYHVTKKKTKESAKLAKFNEPAGVFVSLYKSGCLRGCVGLPYPIMPLCQAIKEAAMSACCDPRFIPLKAEELPEIKIEVSVLSTPEEITVIEPMELPKMLTKDEGLIIRRGNKSALFLPQVWKHFPQPEDFLTQLCMKAGLATDAWKERGCRFWKFSAQIFSEK